MRDIYLCVYICMDSQWVMATLGTKEEKLCSPIRVYKDHEKGMDRGDLSISGELLIERKNKVDLFDPSKQ